MIYLEIFIYAVVYLGFGAVFADQVAGGEKRPLLSIILVLTYPLIIIAAISVLLYSAVRYYIKGKPLD